MTKSTITREQAQKIIVASDEVITALAGTNEDVHPDDSKKMCELWDDLNDRHAPPVVVRELARMALAALDSEPVACGNGCNKSKWHKLALDIDEYMNGEGARESKGRDEIYSEIILRLTRLDVLETILRNEIGLPYGSPIPDIAEKIYDIKRARIYSVVPDVMEPTIEAIKRILPTSNPDEYAACIGADMWNACRSAMLQAGSSPAQSDCCPAQNSVSPAQSPIDHGYRPECECSGCKATARICAELSANSSENPDCWCRTCRPVVLKDMRFVVCPDCGNKRCPRANDHRNACTGSNEPGQEGSAYPDTPQEVKGE
ncbi:hypothetical protein ACWUX8_12445 [Klebsiella pneumoniae]